jgi:hypothetical protein
LRSLRAAIAGGLTVLLAHLLQLGGGVMDVTLQALLIAVFYIVLLRLTCCLTREDLRWIRDVTRTAKQRKAV